MTNFVYIATSLDGFIARPDGAVDFLDCVDQYDEDEDYGFAEFYDGIDALIMGRNTYDVVLGFGVWHYGDKKVLVMTTRDIEIPDFVTGEIIPFEGTVKEAQKLLNDQDCKNLYIDGGKIIAQFLNANLVDEMYITSVPIIISKGIPLFSGLKIEQQFDLNEVHHYENGLLSAHYTLK